MAFEFFLFVQEGKHNTHTYTPGYPSCDKAFSWPIEAQDGQDTVEEQMLWRQKASDSVPEVSISVGWKKPTHQPLGDCYLPEEVGLGSVARCSVASSSTTFQQSMAVY